VVEADKRASTMSKHDVPLLSGRYGGRFVVSRFGNDNRYTSTRSFLARDIRCWLLAMRGPFDGPESRYLSMLPTIIPRFCYFSFSIF
jgi:hypothetical protein